MPKRLRNPTHPKQALRREALAREAVSLRNQAQRAHDSETRVELEEMAERREILAMAFEAIERENAKPAADARGDDAPPVPSDKPFSDKPPSDKPPGAKG